MNYCVSWHLLFFCCGRKAVVVSVVVVVRLDIFVQFVPNYMLETRLGREGMIQYAGREKVEFLGLTRMSCVGYVSIMIV